jgi:hypothetical protein
MQDKVSIAVIVVLVVQTLLLLGYLWSPRDSFTPGGSAALQWGMIRDDTGFIDKRAGNILAESQRVDKIDGMLGSEQPSFFEPSASAAGINDAISVGMGSGDAGKQIAAWNKAMGAKDGMKAPAYVDRMSAPKIQGQVLDPY